MAGSWRISQGHRQQGTLPLLSSFLPRSQGSTQGGRGTDWNQDWAPFWVLLQCPKKEGESTAIFEAGEVVDGGREGKPTGHKKFTVLNVQSCCLQYSAVQPRDTTFLGGKFLAKGWLIGIQDT